MDHDNSPVKEEEYFNEMSSDSSKGSDLNHREIKDKSLKIKGSKVTLEKQTESMGSAANNPTAPKQHADISNIIDSLSNKDENEADQEVD